MRILDVSPRVVSEPPQAVASSTRVACSAQMSLRGELANDPAELERDRAGWDDLAVASGRPYCAPAWMLSWWRAVAPQDAQIDVCLVRNGDELVGVAPLWTRTEAGSVGRYGLLAEGTSAPVEPLARRGLEPEVASVFAELMAGADPEPQTISFHGTPAASPWPRLLAESWPGARAPTISHSRSERVPKVGLSRTSLDGWLSTRSRNFRQQVRRSRRWLEAEGAEFRISTLTGLERDVQSLARLHHARWTPRGGSGALDRSVEAMLVLAGRQLIGDRRFRLWSIEVDGRSISTHLFLAA